MANASTLQMDVCLEEHPLDQPLPRGKESDLDNHYYPTQISGDESLLMLDDVASTVGRCKVVDMGGAIFVAKDRTPNTDYSDSPACCDESIWGGTEPHLEAAL